MGLLDQLAKMVGEQTCPPPPLDPLEGDCPLLWEMLTVDRWGNGEQRMLPRIVIDRVPGGYKVTLQDDSLCIKKEALALSSAEVFKALEAALANAEQPWEAFKSFRNKKGPVVQEKEKRPSRRRR